MKISWGTRIALLYIGFVVMIISLVTATFFNKAELVASNYYDQEIVFQKRLDAAKAANALHERLLIREEGNKVVLRFPSTMPSAGITGTANFYAASNAGADRKFPIQIENGKEWTVERSKLTSARYEVQVSWAANGQDYYQTIPLNVE